MFLDGDNESSSSQSSQLSSQDAAGNVMLSGCVVKDDFVKACTLQLYRNLLASEYIFDFGEILQRKMFDFHWFYLEIGFRKFMLKLALFKCIVIS